MLADPRFGQCSLRRSTEGSGWAIRTWCVSGFANGDSDWFFKGTFDCWHVEEGGGMGGIVANVNGEGESARSGEQTENSGRLVWPKITRYR